MSRSLHAHEAGFTIVELLIATAVLATILLLVTVSITSIGNLFYKDITETRVQDDTRSITNELAQQLQLTASKVKTPATNPIDEGGNQVYAYCIGTTAYTYIVGKQIGTGTGKIEHVLWRDTLTSGDECSPAELTQSDPSYGVTGHVDDGSGTELIAPESRLTVFSITGATTIGNVLGSPFTIDVSLAYGANDVLTTNSGPTVACIDNGGDQFCALSSLTTTVVQRVTTGGGS